MSMTRKRREADGFLRVGNTLVDPFVEEYVETLLFYERDEDDLLYEDSYSIEDMDEESLHGIIRICFSFRQLAGWRLRPKYYEEYLAPEHFTARAAHDFYSTQNGLEPWFLFAPWSVKVRGQLTTIAERVQSVYVYPNGDKLHVGIG